MANRKIPSVHGLRLVASQVERYLEDHGELHRATDGRLFYFHERERRLYDLASPAFRHLLTQLSSLAPVEQSFQYVQQVLAAKVSRSQHTVEVHSFASFESKTGLLAVSDGGGGMWLRERHGDWEHCPNGHAGILFVRDEASEPWEPELTKAGGDLDWFLDELLLAPGSSVTESEQRTLYRVWLLQQFFPPLRRTRLIPAFVGPQGSGKTSAMRMTGRLLIGSEFEVTPLLRDREDAFVAAITNQTLCALDNADSRIKWLPDALATYATGSHYSLRKLYTTNEAVKFPARSIVMLSSRDPHFNRPDVSERLLPLRFARPQKYRPEGSIYEELARRRDRIYAVLLGELARIADLTTKPRPQQLRMADFGSFGDLVMGEARRSKWQEMVRNLEKEQGSFAAEGDGVVEAVRRAYLKAGPIEKMKVGEFFTLCKEQAAKASLDLGESAQGFSRRLTGLQRTLELELGARVRFAEDRTKTRLISIRPAAGGAGGEGEC